ncbi:protein phosphatase 2C domain-containing protein [Chloroflexi bacterium TSY]|nr:protein phosphatase 2C domain-containing protein [Chloroflexi bacterium TSY]
MTTPIRLTKAPLYAGRSDEGYVNKKNEDAWHVFKLGAGRWDENPDRAVYIAIVADGVTSTAGGAQASQLAVETIEKIVRQQSLSSRDPETLIATFTDVIRKTNRHILEVARQKPEFGNMSTTLVLAVVADGQLMIAHLGDSRAYLIRGSDIHRLTLDHTWAQTALDENRITEDELAHHPNRNVIRRYLGINPNIEIDWEIINPGTYQRSAAQRDLVRTLALQQDDVILLGSDGLTDKVEEREIIDVVRRHRAQPKKAVGDLIQLALNQKEQVNITAVLFSLADAPGPSKLRPILGLVMGLVLLVLLGWFGYRVFQSAGQGPDLAAVTALSTSTKTATRTPSELGTETATSIPTASPIAVALVTQAIEQISTDVESETPTDAMTPTKMSTPIAEPTTPSSPTLPRPTFTAAEPSSSVGPTPTRRPTSTHSPTPSATLTPTVTDTPQVVSTATSTVTNTAVGDGTNDGRATQDVSGAPLNGPRTVTLISPEDKTSSKEIMDFAWTADFDLIDNQAFELIFWRPGEDPMQDGLGLAGSGVETVKAVSPAIADQFQILDIDLLWGVRLVQMEPYQPLAYLGGGRSYRFEAGGGGGDEPSNPGGGGCVGALC